MLKAMGCLIIGFFLQSCGAGGSSGGGGVGDSEPEPEEASTIRPVGQVSPGEVAASPSRLPKLTPGLELAPASGTGPGSLLQGILAANVTTTVSGPVAEAAKEVKEALKTKYWTVVQEKGKEYRDGLQKCRLIQSFGRSLSTYYQMYKTSCVLRAFDQEGLNIIRRLSGEELEKGGFFKAASKETVRILEIDGIDFFKTAKVVATIKPLDNGVYQTQVDLCRSNQSLVGRYQYWIIPQEKKFTISYEMIIPGYGIQSDMEFKAQGSYTGFWTTSGAQVALDMTQLRVLSTQFLETNGSGYRKIHQGMLEASASQILIKAVEWKSIDKIQATSIQTLSAQVLSLLTVGSTPESLKVVDAALKSKDRYQDTISNSTSDPIVHQNKIGIAYDGDKTLGFKSFGEAKTLKAVESVDFVTDPLLAKTTLEEPKFATFDSQKCTATGQSTYRASPSMAQVNELLRSCELSLQNLETLCDSIEADEGDVLRALKESPKGIP